MLHELKRIRKAAGLSQESAAHVFGVPLNTWRGWEQCKHVPKDSAAIKRIADYFGVSIEALFGYDLVDPGDLTRREDYERDDFTYRPAYFEIAAGEPIWMQEIEVELPAPSEVLKRHPDSIFVRVVGDSVNRVMPDGCYALVDTRIAEPQDGALCAICVNGYSATIKRVHRISSGLVLDPDSYNPEHKPIIYTYEEYGEDYVTVIGEVVWFMPPFDWEP